MGRKVAEEWSMALMKYMAYLGLLLPGDGCRSLELHRQYQQLGSASDGTWLQQQHVGSNYRTLQNVQGSKV